jgi:hypothetical protein
MNVMARRVRPDPAGYRIVVRGEIGPNLLSALEGISIESVGPKTALVLASADQETLRDALDWLSDAGIEIVSLTQLAP